MAGRDTISFAAHSPNETRGRISGVEVDLQAGKSSGFSDYRLKSMEDVIGSAFDDEIFGAPGIDNDIQGGIGDDLIEGQNGDRIDGGLGQNDCSGGVQVNCNEDSPGNPGQSDQVDITEGGVLIVIGSPRADDISVGYNGERRAIRSRGFRAEPWPRASVSRPARPPTGSTARSTGTTSTGC